MNFMQFLLSMGRKLLSVEFEEVTVCWKKKKLIMHVGEGYTEREIAVKLGMVDHSEYKENDAFLKINPDYKPLNLRSFSWVQEQEKPPVGADGLI